MFPGSGNHHRLPQSQSLCSSHNSNCAGWLTCPLLVLLISGIGCVPSDVSAGHLSCQKCPVCISLDGLEYHKKGCEMNNYFKGRDTTFTIMCGYGASK